MLKDKTDGREHIFFSEFPVSEEENDLLNFSSFLDPGISISSVWSLWKNPLEYRERYSYSIDES